MKKLMCQPATMEGVQEKTRTGSNTKSSVKPKKKAKHTDERPLSSVVGDLVALEPRIMFDGAALATGAEVLQDTTTQDATTIPGVDGETATDSSSAESADEALWSSGLSLTAPSDRKEIVFIDTSVDDYHTLMEGIDPNAEVILLDPTRDGIEQIAEILGERTNVDAVHIISHGDQGELRLGTGVLNMASMQGEYADELATINQALTEEADFLIYGCNFGEGESGVEASTLLAELTGADIAASNDLTGAEALGGDWELEVQTGTIESEVIVDQQAQESFAGVLDITTGLVGHWTFDADATDSSGNSYDGTLTGDASIDTTDATDIVGEGKLALDGTGDYVNLDTHISGFSGLTEGTISAWVKMTDTGESTIFGLSDKDEASELIKFGIEGGQLKWLNLNPAFDDVIVYSTATVNDGAWHHVAVTVNSSGNTLYIDGAVASVSYSSGSSSTTAFFDDITNIDAMDIGRSVRGGVAETEYDGLTDDVRVYNRALSAADIAELATEAPVANNDSATTDMNTAVNIDLTANDTDLDNETITVLDVSNPTNGTVVNNEDGTVTYTPNTSYTGADSFTYLTADLDDTTSYWRLDGDATDAVGSNDGTITGTTTVEGHFGDALSFDEVDDKVVISDFAMNNEFSISFKIKIDDNTGSLFQYIYSHGDIDSTNSLNIFLNEASHVTDPNMLRTVIRDTNDTLSNTALQFDASSIIGDGNWHTYTLTVATGEGAKVYLDGVLQNTDVTRGGDAFDPGTDLYLGTRQDEEADRWYGGSLDSVQVFNRALSASEVTDTHTGGSSLGTVNVTIDPTLVVDTTSDVLDGDTSSISALFASKGADGFISLREAIEAANNTAGTDTISFDISDPLVGGAHTIDVLSALPDITDAVIIDGTTEPDYGSTPIIELDGSSAGAVDGLRLITGSDGSTIQGLVINQFGGDGIEINNSDGNTIVGNYIGTDVTGTVDLGNASAGIRLSSTQNNIIGGTTVVDRNLISGNEGSGIFRLGSNGGNVIQGNYIGTDVTGTLDLGNTQNGIAFAGSGVDTIGGNVAGAGNLISGNNMDGISIGAGANGVIIQGNYIGTNAAGTGAIANTGDGIAVNADNTQIGGTTALARNVISGNTGDGLQLSGDNNIVQGNYIGIDATGTSFLGNGLQGIFIGFNADGNTIGGTVAGARNIISGNSEDGIRIDNATNTTIQGNYVGLNAAGTAAIGNAQEGINLLNTTTGTTIGGTAAGAGNVISGNDGEGVLIGGVSTGTVLQGNYIGTNAAGTAAVGNASNGVFITADGITVGGTIASARNIISGNALDGINVNGAANTTIQGNYIGTDVTGTVDLGNGDEGIELISATNTIIGGSVVGARNVIAGNTGAGIRDENTTGTIIQGNYIGVDATGAAALGNSFGIQTWGTANNGIIGGSGANEGNVIGGNTNQGILLYSAENYTVQGNYIGTDATGTLDLGNGGNGIAISTGSVNNLIGGTGVGEGNVIAFNNLDGITVSAGTGHAILGNQIYANSDLGIDLSGGTEDGFGVTANDSGDADTGANNLQNYPVLTNVSTTGTTVTIQGTLNSTANSYYRIEFFANTTQDGSGHGEAETYLGFVNVMTDGSGDATINAFFSVNVPAGAYVTATATKSDATYSTFSDTSEFALNQVAVVPNAAPTISNLGGDALAYTEGDGAVVIEQGANALVSDVDSSDFDTGTLTVSFVAGSDSAEDVLAIRDEGAGPTNITVSGNTVSYGGTQIGTFTGGNGGTDLVITLDADADATAVSALIQNITYENTDTDNPTTGARTVRYVLTDGDGGTSANYDTTVTVSASNDAPTGLHYTQYLGGSEFIVNSTVNDNQDTPDVTTLTNGEFVVVWESVNQDGSADGVYFQRYDANGIAQGTETQVNTTTANDQGDTRVVALSNGNFAVAWESNLQDGSDLGVYVRVFDATGTALTGEISVNTTTTDLQGDVSLAALTGGGFVATWESNLQDGDQKGIYSQRFDNNGVPQGVETQIHTTTAGSQFDPRVTALNDGGYLIVWDSDAAGDINLMAQRFDATGAAVGSEFQVNTTTASGQDDGVVTALSGGGFVVIWESATQDGSGDGLFGQRFDASGTAIGGEFQVNTTVANDQVQASVVGLDDGGFLVSWQSLDQDGDNYGIYAQQFDAAANKVNGEFQINTTTAGSQADVELTLLQDGRLVAIYESDLQDGSGDTVVGRIFTPTLNEHSPNGTVVAVASQVIDPDDSSFTYSLLDDAGGAFTINNTTGQITVADSNLIDYETSPTINVTVRVTDSGGLTHDEIVTLTLHDVNDAPVNTVPGAQVVAEDTALNISGLSVNDVDGNLSTVELAVSNGTVTVTLSGGATISAGANGTSTLTLSGSQADINATLASLSYQGTLNYVGADTLTMTSTDGNAATDVDVVGITVTAVNDQAVADLNGADGGGNNFATTFTEGSGAVNVTDTDATISDVDNTTYDNLGINLSGFVDGGSEQITVGGYTFTYGTSETVVRTVGSTDFEIDFDGSGFSIQRDISGEMPEADLQTLLRGITYENLSENPTVGNRTLDFIPQDGDALVGLTSTSTITVAATNDAPVITNLGGDALAYTEGDGAVVIDQTTTAAVTDVDSSNFDTGTLTVSFQAGSDSAEDVLSIRDQGAGPTNITVSGSTVSYGGTQIGTFTGGSGGIDLVITLDADADATAVSALIQNITYENTDTDNPTTGARTVRYVLTDGDGGTSANYDTTVTVTGVNDAPVNTVPASVTATEDTSFAFTGANLISTTDVDGNLASTQLTVSNGTLNVTLSGSATISAGANGSATLTISGSATDINATLASLTYQGTLNYTGADTLVVVSTDSAGTPLSDTDNVSITVDPVNDAPVNTVPASVTATEDTSFAFTGANLISTTDVDGNLASTQLTVSNGTLNVTLSGSATISAGANGSATLTISGSATDINATLASLTYQGTLNYTGADTLVMVSTDSAGTPLSDTDNVSITVDPVNDAPVNTVPASVTATEDTSFAFTGANLISTTDVDGNLASTQLTVSNGTLNVTLSGSATISAGANGSATLTISGSATDINATLASLTYQGTLNYTGADTLVVVSTDSAGTPLSDTDNVSITVDPVNDAPVNTVPASVTATEDTSFAFTGANLISTTDVDGNLASTQLTVSNGTLNVTLSGSATISAGANGSATLTISGSATDINATLASLTYQGTLNYTGADTLVVVSTDSAGTPLSDTDNVSITVDPVNDAPVNTVPASVTATEDTSFAFTGANLISTTDVDGNLASTQLTVSNGTLNVTLSGSATISAGANGSATLTISGSATDINATLASLTYQGTLNYTGADTLVVVSTDSAGTPLSDTDNVSITVDPVNDAPVNTVPASVTATEDTSFAFTGANLISTTDVDGNLASTQLTVSNGTLNVTLSGSATISAGANGSATLTISGSATDINATLASLTYQGTLNYTGADTLVVVSTDSAGTPLSDTDNVSITVDPVNDAPVNTVPASVTATEDTSFAFTGANLISTTDVDGNLASTQLTVSNGTLNVTLSGSATISAGANGSATLTISGSATDINATLASLTYQGTLNYTGADTLVVVSTDSAGTPLSDTDNVSITVDPVNDAPVNTVPASVTATEDTSFAFTGANLISTTDVDGNLASTQLTVSNGTLNVTLSGSATISAGANGSATLTISGSATDINATLASLTYQGTLNYTGADTLVMVSTDSAGTPLSDTDNVSITVDPVNDAPVNTVPASVTATEDTSFAFTGANLISTTDVDGNLASTQLTVSNGTLNVTLSGSATISAGANGSATLTISGSATDINATLASLTYQGTLNYTGADTLVVVSTDSAGTPLSDTDNVSITVDPVNDAPVNTVPASVTATEDTSFAFTGANLISTTDVDGNLASTQLTVSNGTLNVTLSGSATISAGANGSATLTISGSATDINATLASLTYQGTLNYTGADTLVMVSTDSAGTPLSDTDNVSITVTGVNDMPIITTSGGISIPEDTSGTMMLSINDPDAGSGNLRVTLTVSNGLISLASTNGLTFTTGDGTDDLTMTFEGTQADLNAALATITYTPDLNYFGSDTLSYSINDLGNTGGPANIFNGGLGITVTSVDDAAVITGDTIYTGHEGDAVAGDLNATDVDGLTDGTYFSVSTPASNGTASIDPATGAWTFTPTDPNWFGTDSFTVTVTDDQGGTTTQVVSVTLANVDDAAVIGGQMSYSGNEGDVGSGTLTATDPDGLTDGTYFTVTTPASNGTAAIDATTGAWTFTPTDQNWFGSDSFTVTVTDDLGGTTTQVISVTLANVNDAPVNMVPGAQTVAEDTALNITGLSVTDVDGNLSTVQLSVSNGTLNVTLSGSATISAGANGTNMLTLSGTQADINATLVSLVYQGTLNYVGADTLVVQSTDSNSMTDVDIVAITVSGTNDAPVANDDSFTTPENTPISTTLATGVLVNDTDLDGDTLTVNTIPVVPVTNGTLVLNTDGSFTYTPNLGFSGLDSFTYEVTDGNGGSAQATVTITVMPVNSAPVITSHGGGASASISMAENLTNVAAMTATDPDGDPLTYSIVGGADAARFAIDSSTGVLEFVAAPDFENPMDVGSDNIYDVQVQVSDGQGGTATQTLAVGITDVMEGLVPPPVPEPTPDSPPEPMPEPEPTPEPDMEPETPAPLPSGVGGSGPSGVISEGVYVGLASRGIEGHVQNIDGRETVDVLELPPLLRPSSWATTSDQIRSYYADPVDMTKAELPPEFLQQLTTFSDELEQTMEDQTGTRSWMVNMVKSTGLALSSGIVAWMVRGGTLVAGLMAAVVPAWRQFDPVPILGMDKKGQEAWTRRVKEAATMEAREHQGLDQILQATNQEPAAPSPSKPPSQSS